MTDTQTVSELPFEPPAPGPWELDPVHFPRPVTRYWAEMHPARVRGAASATSPRFYGMLIDTIEIAYVNGFCYTRMRPGRRPEDVPARFQRAEEVFAGKLWREQVREWDETVKPASIATHREIQAVDPDALSDEELVAYLPRCRDHHAAMISQHMRFTAAAMVPTGDFLAHVGDWTGVPTAELLGLMRARRPISAGASGELAQLVAAIGSDPQAQELLASDGDPGSVLEALRSLRRRRRRRGQRLPRPGRLAAARRLRHLGAVRAGAARRAAAGDPRRRRGARRRGLRPRRAHRGGPREGPRGAPRAVRRAARRGSPDLPGPRRARRLQRHLGLGPDASRGARGRAAARRRRASARGRSPARCGHRGDVRAALRGATARRPTSSRREPSTAPPTTPRTRRRSWASRRRPRRTPQGCRRRSRG